MGADDLAPYADFICRIAERFGAVFDEKDVWLTAKQEDVCTAILKFFNLAVVLSELGQDISLPTTDQE